MSKKGQSDVAAAVIDAVKAERVACAALVEKWAPVLRWLDQAPALPE